MWAFSFLSASWERCQKLKVPSKNKALQMPSYFYIRQEIAEILGLDFRARWMCRPIYTFLCTVHANFSRIWSISNHFDDSEASQFTPFIIYFITNLSPMASFLHRIHTIPELNFIFNRKEHFTLLHKYFYLEKVSAHLHTAILVFNLHLCYKCPCYSTGFLRILTQ